MVLFLTGNSINVRILQRDTKQFYKKSLVIKTFKDNFLKHKSKFSIFWKSQTVPVYKTILVSLKTGILLKPMKFDLMTYRHLVKAHTFPVLKAEIIC